ncbi:hypothetical protein ACFLYU_03705 [Candidatus Dependentiae bacterium]
MKKFLQVFFILFLFSISNFSIADESDGLGDFDIFADDNTLVGDFLDNNEFEITRQSTPEGILEILIDIVKADRILQEDIFLRTNRLNKRSLLDNSLFLMDKDYCYGNWILGVSLFFDQTSRMHFTKPCSTGKRKQKYEIASCIKSYLALTSPTLFCVIKDLESEIKELLPDFDIDCIRALCLFKNATAQERSAGLFFSFMGKIRKFNFRFKAPFYYKIRNFFLTDEERKAISREFGESDEKEGMKFARRHIISDQLGLGDLRFDFDYPVYAGCRVGRDLEVRLGMFSTIPTNVAVVKGLYGNCFKPICCRPSISFLDIFDMLQHDNTRQQAITIAKNFALNALNGISSLLLDSSLGNNRHFGLGFMSKTKIPFRSIFNRSWLGNVFYRGKLSLEYLFSAKEYRWFVEKNDVIAAQFAVRDFEDEDKAAENLAFLETMFTDKFYPFVYKSKVYPGFIFTWVAKLAYESKRWGIHLGWDAWAQTREKIDEICAKKGQLASLDVEKARRPWAFQWTLLGSVFFKTERRKSNLYVGLNAEKTVSSRGIGRPFKVTLSFERNF